MVFCDFCVKDVTAFRDEGGFLSCYSCGKIFSLDNFSTEATFVKDAFGASHLSGRFVRSIQNDNASRERLYEKAYEDLKNIKDGMGMGENVFIVNQAMAFYRMAVERNFTKGRRTEQVQATCLYIACRENRKPYLLIEFSNYLKINIYVLGAVFLQLCKLLHLTERSICQKLLDPSIFIHKYIAKLAGVHDKDISNVALTIISSMNHNWLQTGRKPSGLWGAALYIAALAHGLSCTKEDILSLVHVCEATLSKRLIEFEDIDSGSLTIDELIAKAEELKECSTKQSGFSRCSSSSEELLCQHKGSNRPHFKFGLCVECHEIVIGFDGGSNPPAFQRAEKERKRNSSSTIDPDHNLMEEGLDLQHEKNDVMPQSTQHGTVGGSKDHRTTDEPCYEDLPGDDVNSDSLSDIDNDEVEKYILNEEESMYKTKIWKALNKEYLEEQEAKEAAKNDWEKNFKGDEKFQAMKNLDATVSAAVAKSRKEKRQRKAAEERSLGPAKSAAEAAHRMLTSKKLNSKINFDVLKDLFDEDDENQSKKQKMESGSSIDEEAICSTHDEKVDEMDVYNDDYDYDCY